MFLFPYNNQSVEITACNFKNNSAHQAGAVWHRGGGSSGIPDSEYPLSAMPENTSLLFNSNVFDSNASATQAGALFLSYCNINEIHTCTFKNNTASLGGSIYLLTNRAFTLKNCTFNNNTANNAGAMDLGNATAAVNVINCTFANNIANQYGGAISVPQNTTTINITNCTFANNQANNPGNGQSGAIHSGNNLANSTVTIKNSIFFNNTVTNPWSVWKHCNSNLNDGGNNIFFPENAGGRCVATPNPLIVDPLLLPLANNGGATQTMALSVGSPAIDAGSGCPMQDQRGFMRVGACDIGAFEFNGVLNTTNFEITTNSLSVYPNPSKNGLLFVKLPQQIDDSGAKIEVYSIDGKLILEKVFFDQSFNLSLAQKGFYVLKTTTSTKAYLNKIIVE